MAKAKKAIYPAITLPLVKSPNRFYAFPILGGLTKLIMLIPVFIWLFLLGIAFSVMTLINSFVVLFTGKYWRSAYEVSVLLICLSAKVSYFYLGLTNRYPGFDGKTPDFTIAIPYPPKPNRLFAIPLFGGIVRGVLMIPFLIYTSVIQYAGNLSAIVASFPVLFLGKYPETLYELPRDGVRLNISSIMYFAGLSDTYPSFWISMKHKGVKILFIVLGILLFLMNMVGRTQHRTYQYQPPHYQVPSYSSSY